MMARSYFHTVYLPFAFLFSWTVSVMTAESPTETTVVVKVLDTSGALIPNARFLSYDRETCRSAYRVRSTLDVDFIGNTQLIWAKDREDRAVFSAPTGESLADTFTTWIGAFHEAQVGGRPLRCLVCCAGLVTALLSITGVLIFLRKLSL